MENIVRQLEISFLGKGGKEMNFSVQAIKDLTFRKSIFFGYRKSDVQDFLRHALEDYDSHELKDREIALLKKQVESKKTVLKKKESTIQSLEEEKIELQEENDRLHVLELEKQEIERMRIVAQEAANRVEQESQKIMKRAQKEKETLLAKAEEQRLHALLDVQMEMGTLEKEQASLKDELSQKKQELLTLDYQCHELTRWKKQTEKEVAVFKQELSTIKEQLMEKYSESLDAFLEENLRFEEDSVEKVEQPVLQLHAKKIV